MKKISVNMHEAKTRLSQLVEQAVLGREVVIARNGEEVVRLEPLKPKGRRVRFGSMRGAFRLPHDFNAPLTDLETEIYGR
ncbi:MAG: type II toxin-antitoxin system prevent-host-death family antitoxin [Alphaproteobacteria bacterium]|nr:type II toxin-antitoxin system prevent-host-death family antitoxin [Alphaproteobacteria bacterium]